MSRAPLPPELVEFLKKLHAAVIATVRSDGAPYTAATWYGWDDGRALVNMDFERLRLTHMRRDPRVALTVLDLENWYRAVTVLGRVVEIRDDECAAPPRRPLSAALARSSPRRWTSSANAAATGFGLRPAGPARQVVDRRRPQRRWPNSFIGAGSSEPARR